MKEKIAKRCVDLIFIKFESSPYLVDKGKHTHSIKGEDSFD